MQIKNRVEFKAIPYDKLYYNEDTNYGIYKVEINEENKDIILASNLKNVKECIEYSMFEEGYGAIISGSMQELDLHNDYKFECDVRYNKKYSNYQFNTYQAKMNTPTSFDEQKKFLEVMVTKNQANNLLAIYPNIVEKIMNGDEDIDLNQVKGIGESTFSKIKEKIIDNYVIADLLSTLSPLGITYNQIKKISTLSSNPTLLKEKLNKNPYILTQINGLGFKKVDGIALKLNSDLKISKLRANEFIKYVVNNYAEKVGHTWIYKNDIIDRARLDVRQCLPIIKEIIDKSEFDNSVFKVDSDKIGLMKNYNLEKYIYEDLNRINDSIYDFDELSQEDLESLIIDMEAKQGFKYSEEQKGIIRSTNSKTNNVIIVSGSAGSGKSTVIKGILGVINSMKSYYGKMPIISQCSLSAKAAIRMQETTNMASSTIHRLLKFKNGEFTYNKKFQLKDDVVVVDEISMNNISICNSLFQAIKNGCKLILVFDHAQLPPIGAGAVAYDLLECSNFIKGKFTKVHRQAQDSGILVDANIIRVQKNPIKKLESKIVSGKLKDMRYIFSNNRTDMRRYAINQFFKAIEKYGIDDVSIVTPRKDTVENSSEEINKIIQSKYLPSNATEEMTIGKKTFRIGDKVIQRKNNYDANVFNGEIGYVDDIKFIRDKKGNRIKTLFVKYRDYVSDVISEEITIESYKTVEYCSLEDFNSLELGYALTVHSMQGSQAKAIIVIIDNTHYKLLDSTLLYTAITRAEKRGMLIAEPSAFKRCINTNKTVSRQTYLKKMYETK